MDLRLVDVVGIVFIVNILVFLVMGFYLLLKKDISERNARIMGMIILIVDLFFMILPLLWVLFGRSQVALS